MQASRRRTVGKNGVVAGSSWDRSTKIDKSKSEIKVFNREEGNNGVLRADRKLKRSQTTGTIGKRKMVKSESVEGLEKNPIQLRRTASEKPKSCDESCKELNVSVNGIERSTIEIVKAKFDSQSESCKHNFDSKHNFDESVDEIQRNTIEVRETGSDSDLVLDEGCKEFGVCEEKIMSVNLSNVGQIESPRSLVTEDDEMLDDEELEEEDEEDLVMEMENESFEDKEINVPEEKQNRVLGEEMKLPQIHEKPVLISENLDEQPPDQKPVLISEILDEQPPDQKPAKNMNEEKKLPQMNQKPLTTSAIVKKQSPYLKSIPVMKNEKKFPGNVNKKLNHHEFYPDLSKKASISEEFERIPKTQNKLQNLADLIMWRDVTRSAFIFGLGSFILLSSSFTKDLNFSFISAISYLGLLYLAASFLYRSFVLRGVIYLDDSNQIIIVGEEEAIWLLRLILPYLNEFLLNLKSLFSGDPATTMKLAILLFTLARCGSSITIWKMTKLGFFGVFTVPKICSSYSTQLTGYGNFWVRRFRDAWSSCSHKKAVAVAIFTLVWNLSSSVARIWAAFMLVVVVRYYQQTLLSGDEMWREEDEIEKEKEEEDERGQRQDCGSSSTEVLLKAKKGS